MTWGQEWLVLETTGSTQDEAATRLSKGVPVDVVFAVEQTRGRGRLGRNWHADPGDSLAMSLTLWHATGHPQPWLLGMAAAVAVAEVVDTGVQWPNDIVAGGRKLGGVLVEMKPGHDGTAVPIVGIGLNVNQTQFPESVAATAGSLRQLWGQDNDPLALAHQIVGRFRDQPLPQKWPDLAERWNARDATAGKVFVTAEGGHVAATSIGPNGELVGTCDGQRVTVYAADAWHRTPQT